MAFPPNRWRDPGFLASTAASFNDTIRDAHTTIVPSHRATETARQGALTIFERLVENGGHETRTRLALSEMIGKGGMGVVRLAQQVALGRDVAVKSLRADKISPTATVELLREAWITGSLEHPNVVPVYDMGVDAEGHPLIVFKRITGVTWSQLMHDPATVRERFGATDQLEWNLSILMQVINAVRFAHSRGVVHRDLKPDNVMIGEFGEVYVLDWGIAVSLHDDGTGRFPLARHATDMAGTPCYMAPEMLGGSDPQISERTDIYLLGATLYEILAGRPPHFGHTPLELFTSVAESRPDLPPDAPAGLAQICRRAMDADPARRYATGDEMRLAIQDFLHYRGSQQLAERAEELYEKMLQVIEATKVGTVDHRQMLYNLYGACRFGFLEALEAWSDNAAARDGLFKATQVMIRHELAQNDPRAAAALLGDLAAAGEPPAELKERVYAALRARERDRERMARLEQLDRDLDLRVGSRTRAYVVAIMGVVWTLAPLLAGLRGDIADVYPNNLRMAAYSFGIVILFGIVVYFARTSLLQSAVNRRLAMIVTVAMSGQGLLHLGSEMAGIAPVASQTCQMLMWACVVATVAITVEVRLYLSALGYLASFFAMAAAPDMRFHIMGVANLILSANLVVLWWPRRGKETTQP